MREKSILDLPVIIVGKSDKRCFCTWNCIIFEDGVIIIEQLQNVERPSNTLLESMSTLTNNIASENEAGRTTQ